MAGRAELHLRRRGLRARAAAALGLGALALALAGCGGGGGGGSSGVKLGVPVPWVRAAPSDSQVRLGYETNPCTRARRARVEETGQLVKVTLGDPKLDPKKPCIAMVERHCVIVQLKKPLGGRKVVDGTPHARPRSRELPIEQYGHCQPVQMDD